MPHSSASTSLLLPFGSLMGTIPVDSVERGRVIGEFDRVLESSSRRSSELQQQLHSVIDCSTRTALPPSLIPSGGGGI